LLLLQDKKRKMEPTLVVAHGVVSMVQSAMSMVQMMKTMEKAHLLLSEH
jgi:hypothetical protein